MVAVQDGTVDTLSDYGLGGISLHVTNERGDYFYYAHLSGYAPGVQEGMPVRAGDIVGYVGNTGDAITTPPHLHFEVHPGGGPAVNPFPYLEAWRAQALLKADVTQQEQPQGGNPDGADYWKLRSRELAQTAAEPVLVPLLTPSASGAPSRASRRHRPRLRAAARRHQRRGYGGPQAFPVGGACCLDAAGCDAEENGGSDGLERMTGLEPAVFSLGS